MKQKLTSAPRGTKIVTPGSAPMRGEPTINKNPSANNSFGGGPRNLDHSIPGASASVAAGQRAGRSGAKRGK